MQKVDLVIAGVGTVALVATVLGIVFYEDAIGEETVSFEEVSIDGAFATMTDAGANTAFEWDVPDNATAAEMEVQVEATGTSLLGGSVTVTVTIEGPDGTSHTETTTITIPAGTVQSDSFGDTVTISHRWAEPPETTTIDPAQLNATVWDEPLRITVSFESSGGAETTLSYAASASGDATVYQRAAPELPDPATA